MRIYDRIYNRQTQTDRRKPQGKYSQTITFPLEFPTQCFAVFPIMQIASATSRADHWYQLAGSPTKTSCVVQRQDTGEGSYDVQTTPIILAIGH